MTCSRNQLVLRLVGGELPPAEADALRTHMAGCEACRRAEAELRATWALLGEWSPTAEGAGVLERVLAAADRSTAGRRNRGGVLRILRRPAVRAAASVALAAGLGMAAGRLAPGERDPGASSAPVDLDEVIVSLGLADLASPGATGLPELFSADVSEEAEQP